MASGGSPGSRQVVPPAHISAPHVCVMCVLCACYVRALCVLCVVVRVVIACSLRVTDEMTDSLNLPRSVACGISADLFVLHLHLFVHVCIYV